MPTMTTRAPETDAYPVWNGDAQEFYWYTGMLSETPPDECEAPCDAYDESAFIAENLMQDEKALAHFQKHPLRHVATWMNYPPRWSQKANRWLQGLVEHIKERLADEGVLVDEQAAVA